MKIDIALIVGALRKRRDVIYDEAKATEDQAEKARLYARTIAINDIVLAFNKLDSKEEFKLLQSAMKDKDD